ncbi:MAG TPA: DUF6596 domain-containing protein, partial [Streptomyces sp.]|nr:DUF6596 domain-containing protein [Streptomyces sp.]
ERRPRLATVLRVLYLVFNEGHTATSGPALQRVELSSEAIRLTRAMRDLLPDEGEVAGLLALMLLTDARRTARTDNEGNLIPLNEQDRSLWNRDLIAEGVTLVSSALSRRTPGPYQLQAAIAAVHDEAERAVDTDWPQILALYDVLRHIEPGPVVELNRTVALAMVHGPRAGLDLLRSLENDPHLTGNHRLQAVRAHLLEQAGDIGGARHAYYLAASNTLSIPEKRYLQLQAARLAERHTDGA